MALYGYARMSDTRNADVVSSRRGEGIVERSQVRYSAAGLLIATGLLVGGTGGVAIADPGGTGRGGEIRHESASGDNGSSGGTYNSSGGTTRSLGGLTSSDGTTGNPHRKPLTKFGSGRDGTPSRKPGGNKPADKKPADNKGGDNRGECDNKHECRGTNRRGWLSVSDYFKQWTNALANVPIPNLLSQPQPGPQPNIRTQIAGPEPVNSSGGGGGGTEPVEPATAEPPVLQAPPIAVAPPLPELPPPPVVVSAPPGGVNTWLGPRVLPEPPATGSSIAGQPVPPAAEPPPASIGTPMGTQASQPAGYTAYLRPLRLPELAAAALPGVGGILLLTAGGSFIGYRQAKAGQSVRTRRLSRFLQ
jgi:hypothetical protein